MLAGTFLDIGVKKAIIKVGIFWGGGGCIVMEQEYLFLFFPL